MSALFLVDPAQLLGCIFRFGMICAPDLFVPRQRLLKRVLRLVQLPLAFKD